MQGFSATLGTDGFEKTFLRRFEPVARPAHWRLRGLAQNLRRERRAALEAARSLSNWQRRSAGNFALPLASLSSALAAERQRAERPSIASRRDVSRAMPCVAKARARCCSYAASHSV
jgi:hypothetical protein